MQNPTSIDAFSLVRKIRWTISGHSTQLETYEFLRHWPIHSGQELLRQFLVLVLVTRIGRRGPAKSQERLQCTDSTFQMKSLIKLYFLVLLKNCLQRLLPRSACVFHSYPSHDYCFSCSIFMWVQWPSSASFWVFLVVWSFLGHSVSHFP